MVSFGWSGRDGALFLVVAYRQPRGSNCTDHWIRRSQVPRGGCRAPGFTVLSFPFPPWGVRTFIACKHDSIDTRQRQDKRSFATSNSSSVANTNSRRYINNATYGVPCSLGLAHQKIMLISCLVAFVAPPPHCCRILFRSGMR